jgi:hypothetical protein
MVDVGMSPMPQKLLRERFVCGLTVLQGYQKTLNPKASKHLNEKRIEKNKRIYEGGKGRCAM